MSDVNALVTDENALKVEWNVTCTYEFTEPQESSSVEVITAPANSTSEENPEVKENLPFFLRDLKDAYSVYEVK